MARTLLAAAVLGLLTGCSGTKPDAAPERADVDDMSTPQAETMEPSRAPPLRVLVTGFHDWEQLGEPPNIWRCRDNPSCRLLVGDESSERPTAFGGPLVQALQAAAPEHSWQFSTLPVTWGAYEDLDTSHVDVVVNLGLGVYDTDDQIFLEQGAYNLRRGADARGADPDTDRFEEHRETVREPDSTAGKLAAFDGRTFGDYAVVLKQAREDNSYLCNETHLRALADVRASQASEARALRAAYFVHIPYAKDDDYGALAEGVSGLVTELVGLQAGSS